MRGLHARLFVYPTVISPKRRAAESKIPSEEKNVNFHKLSRSCELNQQVQ